MRSWARALKRELRVLAIARNHPQVPRAAKLLAVLVVAYALSPIDLIPDAIPVLGLVDDLVLLPIGILVVRRLIPPRVLAECGERADEAPALSRRAMWIMGLLVVATWIALAVVVARWLA